MTKNIHRTSTSYPSLMVHHPKTARDGQMSEPIALSLTRSRVAVIAELRRLLPGREAWRKTLPFGLAALDACLPAGGLACGALHEIVPETEGASAAAFGFIVAILARLSRARPLIFVMPGCGRRRDGGLF